MGLNYEEVVNLDIKVISGIFQEVGAGNTALIIILFLFSWGFVRIINVLPKAINRLVAAIENLGTTFVVHDTRSTVISQSIITLQAEVHELIKTVANQDSIIRVHKRQDDHNATAATKEDVGLILKALGEHTKDCQDRSNQINRDILERR